MDDRLLGALGRGVLLDQGQQPPQRQVTRIAKEVYLAPVLSWHSSVEEVAPDLGIRSQSAGDSIAPCVLTIVDREEGVHRHYVLNGPHFDWLHDIVVAHHAARQALLEPASEAPYSEADDPNLLLYDICVGCSHFVERNDAHDDDPSAAEYVHLDDGEQEYDHDARPTGDEHPLDWWRQERPELFVRHEDGRIGPNSLHFGRSE